MDTSNKKYSFKKKERLTKKVEINRLFNEGSSFSIYPLKFIYLVEEDNISSEPPVKLLLSVPKRIHKRAVNRNLIKRRLKECYRKYKPKFFSEEIIKKSNIKLGIIYISNEILSYQELEKKIILGTKKLTTEIAKRNSFY